MSTYLQLLRLNFWGLTLQKRITAVCVAVLACVLATSLFSSLPYGIGGVVILIATAVVSMGPLLFGGALLRSASAPRSVRLLPRGKARLLLAEFGVLLTCAVSVTTAIWLGALAMRHSLTVTNVQAIFVAMLLLWTYLTLAMFVASRSPVWMLLVVLPGPQLGRLLPLAGIENPVHLLQSWQAPSALALLWTVFGIIFLRSKQIRAPYWFTSDGGPAFPGEFRLRGIDLSPARAVETLLLGGSSVHRIAWQSLLSMLLLMGLHLLAARRATAPGQLATALAILPLAAVASSALMFVLLLRSRQLWLVAGLSRSAAFAACERLMLRVVGWLTVFTLAMFVAGWALLDRDTRLNWFYLVPALMTPGLIASYLWLTQVNRWTLRAIAFHGVCWLAIAATWYLGVYTVLRAQDAGSNWGALAAQLVMIGILRAVAISHWRTVEWPRRARAAPVR